MFLFYKQGIFHFHTGRLSLTHSAPYPTAGSGYFTIPGNGCAPLLRYAFTFSPHKKGSFPRTIPHSIKSAHRDYFFSSRRNRQRFLCFWIIKARSRIQYLTAREPQLISSVFYPAASELQSPDTGQNVFLLWYKVEINLLSHLKRSRFPIINQ